MKPALFRSAVVLAVISTSAWAQNVQVDVEDDGESVQMQGSVPGMNVDMRVQKGPRGSRPPPPAPAPTAAQPPPRVIGAESFSVSYEPGGKVGLRVLDPEGAQVEIWNQEGEREASMSAPCTFEGRGGRFYRVILSANGAVVYDRKVEVRDWNMATLRAARGAPPPLAGPAPRGGAMPPPQFSELLTAMKNESFSDGKLAVLESVMPDAYFTIDQVGQLVDAFDHSSDKVKAVGVVKNNIIDRQNAFKLYGHFDFDSDKKAVKSLLGK